MCQEISLCSGKDCCDPESMVVFSKILLCSEKDCCVLKKIVVFFKRLLYFATEIELCFAPMRHRTSGLEPLAFHIPLTYQSLFYTTTLSGLEGEYFNLRYSVFRCSPDVNIQFLDDISEDILYYCYLYGKANSSVLIGSFLFGISPFACFIEIFRIPCIFQVNIQFS